MTQDTCPVPPECSLPDMVDGSFGGELKSLGVPHPINVCLPIVIGRIRLSPKSIPRSRFS
jgi:hypothetical protein